MPLFPHDESRLCELIMEMLTLQELEQVVHLAFSQRLEDMIRRGPGQEMCAGLVSLCARQGKLVPLLREIQRVRPHAPRAPELAAFIERLRAEALAWSQPRDPFDAWFLHASQPFVNRIALRSALRDLHADDGARVLMIDGEPHSGKSYTYQLIAYLAHKMRFKVIWVDLVTDAFTGYSPWHLARSIAAQMGVHSPLPEQRDETGARYAITLRDWLVGELARSGEDWWLVLDGVRQVDLDPAVQDLIQHLMIRAQMHVRNLRVAALACREDFLPAGHGAFAHQERTAPIARADLVALFEGLLGLRGTPFEPAAVHEAVRRVEQLLDDARDAAERMSRLPQAVRAVADALFTVLPALPAD